jgi:phosphatidylglycerol:prolipoprotein diacylglycerol transferase
MARATEVAYAGLLGGLLGAKVLFALEHWGSEPLWRLLLDRGGMSWYGGLFGGSALGILTVWRRGWPLLPVVAAATPALAMGQALGRVGCFLVGDDYGLPTALPWGVAFPQGLPPTSVPVHPTQLYEAVFLVVLAVLLTAWRRQGVDDRSLLSRYCLIGGSFRFLLEFVRVNVRVAGGLTVAQYASLALVAIGAWLAWPAATSAPSAR